MESNFDEMVLELYPWWTSIEGVRWGEGAMVFYVVIETRANRTSTL